MELKSELKKPYTGLQKNDFIIENNHQNGYEIKETDTAIEAWGYSTNEQLQQAKAVKYAQTCEEAYNYLNEGKGLYEFANGKHIEATCDNFAKLTPYMIELAFKEIYADSTTKMIENITNLLAKKIKGVTVQWTTKEDEIVNLNILQIINILKGIGQIQSDIWGVKFLKYKEAIKNAKTIAEVNSIEINYDKKRKIKPI